jgi:hypothetical protein
LVYVGIGLFLMLSTLACLLRLSSFLFYLIRSRGNFTGHSHTPIMRVFLTLIVGVSWLGGMALLLLFAPTSATNSAQASGSIKGFLSTYSYFISFSCLFVLGIFVAIRSVYESVKFNGKTNGQVCCVHKCARVVNFNW